MAEAAVNDRRRWYRFSLRSAIAVVSVVVLAFSHGLTSYRLYQSDKELAKLRRETGYLDISDVTKVHVVAVPVMDHETQRWRVYIPSGADYSLAERVNDIPVQGFPDDGVFATLTPGEWVIELRTQRVSEGKWTFTYHAVSESSKVGSAKRLEGAPADWLDGGWVTMTQQTGTQRTETFDVGEKVLLVRQRSDKTSVGTAEPAIAPGVMLWLTP